MRDFRDAKAMAHTIRAALTANGLKISVSQSLELIAKAFGVADWNTLSAAISADSGGADPGAPRRSPSAASAWGADSRSEPEYVGFSPELEASLHRAVASAKQRSHDHLTLDHLLLAFVDDGDASAVMKACKVDLDLLRTELRGHLDSEPGNQTSDEAKPTAAFQRVI